MDGTMYKCRYRLIARSDGIPKSGLWRNEPEKKKKKSPLQGRLAIIRARDEQFPFRVLSDIKLEFFWTRRVDHV